MMSNVKFCFLCCNCLGFAIECNNITVAQYLPMNYFNDFMFISISFASVIEYFLQWSLDHAKIFVFTNNGDFDFQRFIFNCHFVLLYFLDLSRNLISKLPSSATTYNKTRHKHLSVMILSSNQIQTIETHAFEDFYCLVYLDLSQNQIIYLQAHVFGRNLKGLNLSGNQILTARRTSFVHTDLQFLSTEQHQICCMMIHNPSLVCTKLPLQSAACDRLFASFFHFFFIFSF